MAKNLWLVKLALKIAGGKMLRALNKASKDVYKAQHKILMDVVNYSKDTVYGKEHNFDKIETIEDFQKQVPINSYENLRPYIKRHTKGEENVIVSEKPMLYATTSGTTREPKWIPITPKYYKECYNGLSKLWFHIMLKQNPHMFDGHDLTVVGKAVEGYTEDGTAYGSFSGHVYKNIPKIMRSIKIVPPEVYWIDDYYSKYYTLLRFTLPENITAILTGNPSTLVELHNVVTKNIDALIEDIEKGTLRKDLDIKDEIREAIEPKLKADPERANELRELKKKYTILYPKHYWSNLAVITTWITANSGMYLQHTKGFYPEHTKIRDFAYIATEMRAGMIMDNDDTASTLMCHMGFFEFIKKEDIHEDNPKIYLANEVEEGQLYYLFITAPNGMFRYNINDIIRVDGFYNQFPKITFVQKGEGVTTLTGEKLYERQLMDALQEVENKEKMLTNFYIAFADFNTSSYHLFVEFKENYDDDKYKKFCTAVDKALREINVEYESKRGSNRIKPLNLHILESNAFQEYKNQMLSKGYRDGQFKLVHLQENNDRMKLFENLTKKSGIKCEG